MKLGILSSNAFVKCFTLVVMMLFSYDGAAQEYTYNIGYGKSKIYTSVPQIYSTDRNLGYICIANIISSKDEELTKDVIADKITFCSGEYSFSFSSSYGNFVEFQSYAYIKSVDDKNCCVFIPCIRDTEDGYFIVQNGSNLYLVQSHFNGYTKMKEDKVGIITTDLNNKGDDFQIIKAGRYIYILNNGVLKVYSIYSILNSSSVSSPKANEDESKIYSIDGMQVETPHNGIFIKGNKKAFVK